MNELTKSLIFVVVAVAAVAGAIIGRPGRVGVEAPDQIGQVLFPEFEDPSTAQELFVARYDEDQAAVEEFSVAKKNGEWVIPSHDDYPADATENLKIASNLFVGMKVINVAGDRAQDHVEYGVVEPKVDSGDIVGEGVGKLVSLKDAQGNRLAELIVGKDVKGLEGQRYARIPGQDRVYTVDIDPSELSTTFGDWIVQDVINFNAIDIERMAVRDYSVSRVMTQQGPAVSQEQRSQFTVKWNGDDFKWDLEELLEFRGGSLKPTQLLESEELDKTRLDEMKNAIASLKIADVARKPEILREGLKDGQTKLSDDQEGVMSLFNRGFYPAAKPGGKIELVSSDGEVNVFTKNAVQLTMRFGAVAGSERSEEGDSLNRYVMLTASVDEDSIPKPVLEEVPGAAEPDAGDPEGAADDESGEDDSEEDASGDDEIDRISKENQRKLDEYNDKLNKAQVQVSELNARFADWYYVISDDVFKDVHLTRKDIITMKETSADEGTGVDSFRKLEEDGLRPATPLQGSPPPRGTPPLNGISR